MTSLVKKQDDHFHNYFDWLSTFNINHIICAPIDELSFNNILKQRTLSLIIEANKSFRTKSLVWNRFETYQDQFGIFLKCVIRLAISNNNEFELKIQERIELLTFLNYTFNSIEQNFVNQQIRKYLSLSLWSNLSKKTLDEKLSKLPSNIRQAWLKLEKQIQSLDTDKLKEKNFECKFLSNYISQFLQFLPLVVEDESDTKSTTNGGFALNSQLALYCLRFIEFIIDLESQLPLRRFLHSLLEQKHFLIRCRQSKFAKSKSPEGYLFSQLIELLTLYYDFEIDIITGNQISDLESVRLHENKILALQKILWKNYQDLKEFSLMSVESLSSITTLRKILENFNDCQKMFNLLVLTGLVDESSFNEDDKLDLRFMAEIFLRNYIKKDSHLRKINSIPLLPSELVIWDTNLVPDSYYNYEYPLPLPKLNLQFITTNDYLLRNFMLFKNESTYGIRQDLEEHIVKTKCKWNVEGRFCTGPKQRMALIIKDFKILEVCEPRLGEDCPSQVTAKVLINMDYVRNDWRKEWEELRKNDVCFLVSFTKNDDTSKNIWPEGSFPSKHCIRYVRGCEIEALLDHEDKIVTEQVENPKFKDNLRTYLVKLDCNQYKIDHLNNLKDEVYDKFHLIVRRKPEQNNFKGVLNTVKDLINSKFVVPIWLRSLLLGFGDPGAAHYTNLKRNCDQDNHKLDLQDLHDTFIDYNHILESLSIAKAGYKISISDDIVKDSPYRIYIDENEKNISIFPYKLQSKSPYESSNLKRNSIRFTPAQIDAIITSLQFGLSMIVGPPGTGKTDVAVQILSCLYHSYPNQRTLVVTHSNQALNQIFEKMIQLDVEEHHVLRLGHGQEDINSESDFSRKGRVSYVIQKMNTYLHSVLELAKSLDIIVDTDFTCETAQYFYVHQILPRWNAYLEIIEDKKVPISISSISEHFPFSKYFSDIKQLFGKESYEHDLDIAQSCFRHIKNIFDNLRAFRPFEIFNNTIDRSQYLLIKEARIIAMTCTHAGLRRQELVEMGFQYDNILMEESGQILEIETAIPLLLQNPENGVNRLKRWIMIGDHNQLPPIIQNSAFQKFSNMDQSMFARFVRLGVPHILLNAQGRCRSTICDLYRWRYGRLIDLPHISEDEEYKLSNPGFVYEYQIINIDSNSGSGEESVSPHVYINREEAKFVLATYKYMRSLGYKASRISILTTYNGQKQHLKEIFNHECSKDAYLGFPSRITTVDKYQGQQNDYILLSLVRTKNIGHIRDIRRLVVAMSRARLGLYVFCKISLFASCIDLRSSINLFLTRPQSLMLVLNEKYPTKRTLNQEVKESLKVNDLDHMLKIVNPLYERYLADRVSEQAEDC